MSCKDVHVLKVGGSLLDFPQLLHVLEQFIATTNDTNFLLVVGGARSADAVRIIDKNFGLDEQRAHWLAVRGMSLNAYLLAEILNNAILVHNINECAPVWQNNRLAIVEPIAWLEYEEIHGFPVEHCWQFTSDSISAHIAAQLNAPRLTLLKSTLPDEPLGCPEAAAAIGLVDGKFPEAIRNLQSVTLINARDASLPAMPLETQIQIHA
ncbi:Uridylate kinase [Poriferisphaera corsica]|uniref:Uridylate kinase n=1 Tax=Poriferisphaera corsica TaxID=2528020 RepID=A0A517YXN8_9BACT|nr:hypothetical protein [Poriferisphaera corsica]QDU34969.1 Uridylate kinase [Poriferisphaera corsica]